MGYAVIMFVILLLMSVSIALSANYGISKDSQKAPLLAENAYAEMETGRAQTGLMINNTCLTGNDRYLTTVGSTSISGPHTLNLVIKNNGSTILNPNKVTVIYNSSYVYFSLTHWDLHWDPRWEQDGGKWVYELDEVCRENPNTFTVWAPLSYVCIKVSNIYISTPDSPQLRLLVSAENGVSTIAPTSPTNFTGRRDNTNTSYIFSWNASYDEDGIAYYHLYGLDSSGVIGECKKYNTFQEIPGSISSFAYDYSFTCGSPGNPCNADWYYLTAVDKLGNEGIQSRTIKCNPSPKALCTY